MPRAMNTLPISEPTRLTAASPISSVLSSAARASASPSERCTTAATSVPGNVDSFSVRLW